MTQRFWRMVMLDLNFANEIQSWIAVKSFAVEDANPQAPIIDANELADFITSLVSKYQDEANISNLSPDTNELIDNFARQMKVKLHKAQEKYGYNDNWKNSDWETTCKVELYRHLDKGDPIDVANYCAFMHFHKWPTNFENSAYSLMPYEPTEEMMCEALQAIKSEIGKEHVDVKIIYAWKSMFHAFSVADASNQLFLTINTSSIPPDLRDAYILGLDEIKAKLAKYESPDVGDEAKKNSSSEEASVILNGHDIKYISEFMCYTDPENLDHEVTIQDCLTGFDGKGLYAWVTEYPEEGGIKLGDVEAARGGNHD